MIYRVQISLCHIDYNKEFGFYPKGNVEPLKGFKKKNMIKFSVYKNYSSVQRKYWRRGKTRGPETSYERLLLIAQKKDNIA